MLALLVALLAFFVLTIALVALSVSDTAGKFCGSCLGLVGSAALIWAAVALWVRG